MPVFEGEKNFNPHYFVIKLSSKYRFKPVNQCFCIVDYQPDGMSANIWYQYRNSPKSFAEFCESYYTKTDELRAIDAHFGWRNEIDCLLKFALWNMGEEFGILGVGALYELLMADASRANIILTKEDKCVGWSIDGVLQLHPKYRGIEIIDATKKN
jgi:hypothetical protein